ncbi:MAG TPA: hypothetical protein VE890_10150 [Thermoguttaceae bacterium]|nr:hypothetical protein [Thermoguttaceae bacterium]
MCRLVANLTVVAMLMHSVLGCCWHHSHAGQPERSDSQAALLFHTCCHHDDHSCSNETAQQDGQPTPGKCDGSRCLFVGATRTIAVQQVSADASVASLALIEDQGSPASSPLGTTTDLSNRPVRPSPVYLRHQVFLL